MTFRANINGLRVRSYSIRLGRRNLTLLGPTDPDGLLDDPRTEQRFYAENEYMPYWARPWPAAVMLAEFVLARVPAAGTRRLRMIPGGMVTEAIGGQALEIGCGLGLCGLAVALAGWDVTLTDYEADALAFARASAALNKIHIDAFERLDWTSMQCPDRFDLILAADVLFESRWVEPVAEFLKCNLRGGRALIADPNRRTAEGFADAVEARGLSVRASSATTNQPDGIDVHGTVYDVTASRERRQ